MIPGLCQCGCGGSTSIIKKNDASNGRVNGAYYKFLNGHANRILGPDYTVSANGCWMWAKTMYKNGYGKIHVDGKQGYAHIHYYEQKNGPVPDGLELDHLCRTPRCVRPDHLEAVRHAINIRRGAGTVLNKEDVVDIRLRFSVGESRASIARSFHVSAQHVGLIVRGLKYKL